MLKSIKALKAQVETQEGLINNLQQRLSVVEEDYETANKLIELMKLEREDNRYKVFDK